MLLISKEKMPQNNLLGVFWHGTVSQSGGKGATFKVLGTDL